LGSSFFSLSLFASAGSSKPSTTPAVFSLKYPEKAALVPHGFPEVLSFLHKLKEYGVV
jgi:hypothetical protein